MAGTRHAWRSVFCFAFGVAVASCVGGPTSDWPDKANEEGDDNDDGDDDKSPPNSADAGVSRPLDAASMAPNESGDGASSCSPDAALGDGSVASDGATAGDGAMPVDAGVPLDGSTFDASTVSMEGCTDVAAQPDATMPTDAAPDSAP